MTGAIGTGYATLTAEGDVLDVLFTEFALSTDATASGTEQSHEGPLAGTDEVRGTTRVHVRTVIEDLEAAPADTFDAYLRLHLISGREIKPHGCNLDGVFGKLNNVVWTNHGPCKVEGFAAVRERLQAERGPVTVYSVDKFPRMVDYVVPTGVRIGDADRVRLGAHLAEGTTVMHEGFVNFNAGTLGSSMVEGRISGGVVVGNGSDVGGGASIMGTLSGGGKQVISVGERCLLGANSGIGISIGDDVTVEAGLYLTYGTKVVVRGAVAELVGAEEGAAVKAAELSGQSSILFRRNSVSGEVEAVVNTNAVELNEDLHKN
ncbi:2,3,4,5-tetrahydropyridine-2,6-dicarboxylate N-succinyltransferase [Corynebacterium sp. 320]|uniref:2,3,4,5-tetrahydropyridine-2,6-dicarboxylate N-succinyltransferase n=1 Tax=Corynebacterium TaxID=1716 RepID=UPI00125CB691|nr:MULTISPECIES: 2,3,4,5-tetrahydropyridine-2,6-dicarboxylate N-succinyltransferase [Corynebacterium]KAB1503978.1 2,3,4,5-tetrahydropyridine-2,6-dicarboxylate N-succinyltransferase [Corynebacterium sp. 320]KAB1552923.1 2,3,4,5-tetrahydropyridine-2,6-dicarboxylate N-succinyltransferase [Corynebacterium sp. 321]KAB1553858.1 2,3,4,5-tetrahydropyridine-2,6-dicarboxylate N-succinyltransferase [Corynebacterium sp. 319]KAB3528114.1 2,3,4,5-tetrahydropyridine-2,6-dicarboxylate N-succinyltransferase [Co